MKMTEDDITVERYDSQARRLVVSAHHGTVGMAWPTQIEFDNRIFVFSSNETITADMDVGGLASYVQERN